MGDNEGVKWYVYPRNYPPKRRDDVVKNSLRHPNPLIPIFPNGKPPLTTEMDCFTANSVIDRSGTRRIVTNQGSKSPKSKNRRRLSPNQRLIERFIRESIRCIES